MNRMYMYTHDMWNVYGHQDDFFIFKKKSNLTME